MTPGVSVEKGSALRSRRKGYRKGRELLVVLLMGGPLVKIKGVCRHAVALPVCEPFGGMPLVAWQTRVIEECLPEAKLVFALSEENDRAMTAKGDARRVLDKHDCWVFGQLPLWEAVGKIVEKEADRKDLLLIHGDLVFNHTGIRSLVRAGETAVPIMVGSRRLTKKPGVVHTGGRLLRIAYGVQPPWGQMLYIRDRPSCLTARGLLYEGGNSLAEEQPIRVVASAGSRIIELERRENLDWLEQDSDFFLN